MVPDHEISTASLSRILRKCTRLASLEVTDQPQLEDIVRKSLSPPLLPSILPLFPHISCAGTTVGWTGAHLRQLSIVRCKYIFNTSLLFLSRHCGRSLELLNLKGISTLFTLSPHLSLLFPRCFIVLDLVSDKYVGCSQFNEAVLHEVICNCPKLEYHKSFLFSLSLIVFFFSYLFVLLLVSCFYVDSKSK